MNLKKQILAGKIFIYPTDTVYGIGCNALNKESVREIREIKKRDEKPFSVIAPSFKWIEDNCIIDTELRKYLPGPYTIILKKKDKNFLSHVSEKETIGIRIPDNEFTKRIQEAGVPFITTSVNFSGEKPANNIEEIPKEILEKVNFIFNSGELSGKPSTLIIEGKEIKRD
ncbi:MAG TPA: L-threonylcarbamoyladenylate synthase [Patescibacteria group bacterium]|nr:L-threonylcarbamoyladenylate synthase [Patescibacteria group bacterium]